MELFTAGEKIEMGEVVSFNKETGFLMKATITREEFNCFNHQEVEKLFKKVKELVKENRELKNMLFKEIGSI